MTFFCVVSCNKATAPFSATMALTGHLDAKGMLQHTGLPVMGMTMRPLTFSSCSASSASGVMAPSVVSVSSMSVKTPTILLRELGGQEDRGFMSGTFDDFRS